MWPAVNEVSIHRWYKNATGGKILVEKKNGVALAIVSIAISSPVN